MNFPPQQVWKHAGCEPHQSAFIWKSYRLYLYCIVLHCSPAFPLWGPSLRLHRRDSPTHKQTHQKRKKAAFLVEMGQDLGVAKLCHRVQLNVNNERKKITFPFIYFTYDGFPWKIANIRRGNLAKLRQMFPRKAVLNAEKAFIIFLLTLRNQNSWADPRAVCARRMRGGERMAMVSSGLEIKAKSCRTQTTRKNHFIWLSTGQIIQK